MNVGLYITKEELFKLLKVVGIKWRESFCRTVADTELCFA